LRDWGESLLPNPDAQRSEAGELELCKVFYTRRQMIVLKVDMLVKPGAEQQCREYIQILQEHSRREPGCLMYIGHQSTEDPRKFLFYEQYKDDAALEAHRNAPYFKQYVIGGLDTIMEHRSRDLYTLVE
jgi:quinol monooxygenase YgiN